MISIQKYVQASSLQEAWELNQKKRNRIIGGMVWLKMGKYSIDTAIDLCALGLDTITESEEEFSVGAMTSLRQLENHPGLDEYSCGAVKAALRDIVGVQFRNVATVGGSLWGRFGFSDVLSVFLAMDSYVELYKGGIVPLEEFASMKKDNDILVRLIIKKTPGRFAYQAVRIQHTDFPVLNCTVSRLGDEYRAIFGARPGRAIVLRDEKGILANGVTAQSAAEFAAFAKEAVPTGSNMRGSAAYRSHLAGVLAERCITELGGML